QHQNPTVWFYNKYYLTNLIAPDSTKRRHIGVANTVKYADQKSREMPRKNLLRVHTARLASPACARTDHEVLCAAHNRLDQRRNKARNVAAIAIEKNDQIAFMENCRHARRAGATVSARRRNHSRSCVSGAFRGLV